MQKTNINVIQQAVTLPRKTTLKAPNQNKYCQYGECGSEDKNEELNHQQNQFGETIKRPTYGAYANVTLPRGPYLQYKFHANYDNKKFDRLSKNFDVNYASKFENINNSSNNLNNNERITMLKQEFNGLPRVRLLPSITDISNNPDKSQSELYFKCGNRANVYNEDVTTRCENNNDKMADYLGATKSIDDKNIDLNNLKFRENLNHSQKPMSLSSKSFSILTTQQRQTKKLQTGYYNNFNLCSNNLHFNFVTLADVNIAKPNGLSQLEGWALLCQSVQALQDMFLADTPPPNKIRPLVNPQTLQITSRGRVTFSILSANMPLILTHNELNNKVDSGLPSEKNNDNIPPFSSIIMDYLSPEYISCISQKAMFSESDIEKMWIYSLGVTLKQTISSQYIQGNSGNPSGITGRSKISVRTADAYHLSELVNEVEHKTVDMQLPEICLSALDKVILSMCEPKSNHRASLMFLLDIISEYCKNHQTIPFSHIVKDLFKEVETHLSSNAGFLKRDSCKYNMENVSEDNRSDTDSGRSSDLENMRNPYSHIIKYLPSQMPFRTINQPKLINENPLKVTRIQKNAILHFKFGSLPHNKTFGTDGGEFELKHNEKNTNNRKHPIVRRINKRTESRRNTIEVNTNDLFMAKKQLQSVAENPELQFNFSKSTDHIDKIKQQSSCNIHESNNLSYDAKNKRISLPDLTLKTVCTIPKNLKVRRHRSVRDNVDLVMPPKNNGAYVIKSPEFIRNASLPPKFIDISEAKDQQKRYLNVLLINGTKVHLKCNPITVTARQVFEAVIKYEGVVENFFLGLCALIGGDFVFLPMDLKIYKVAPQVWINLQKKSISNEIVSFPLFVRIKFYLPTLRGISSLDSRHLFYLQLRKNVLEQQTLCTEDDLITLGGLALQAEIGDFKDFMRQIEYFTTTNYIPEITDSKPKDLAKYLRSSHFGKKGLNPVEAEHNFIRYMQELKEYGMHLYSAVWLTDDGLNLDVYVTISLKGIAIFERNVQKTLTRKHNEFHDSKNAYQRHLYSQFEWFEIENFCYTKHILCVIVHKTEGFQSKQKPQKIKYKLKMEDRKSYFAFNLASEHHKFYLKLRNSFVSVKELADELNTSIISESFSHDNDRRLVTEQQEFSTSYSIAEANIDKPIKSTGLRNLKKSMLNDHRLLKLKQKFLRRTKSSVSSSVCPTSFRPGGNSDAEKQNKENENPRLCSNASDLDLSGKMRNKVKMGTRAFSVQFLNKSFDNLHNSSIDSERLNQIGSCADIDKFHSQIDSSFYSNNVDENIELGMSLTSNCFDSNIAEKELINKENTKEACVIQTSIKSDFNLPVPDETVSDSLLEKFENLSCNTSIYDRIIKRIIITKELNSKIINNAKTKEFPIHKIHESQSHSNFSEINHQRYTLGISVVQGSDKNVYVKDMVDQGPSDKAGVKIGDQILAVNGVSLLHVPYEKCINLLQNTPLNCELIISQIVSFKQDWANTKSKNISVSPKNIYPDCYYNSNFLSKNHKRLKSKSTETISHKNSVLFETRTDDRSSYIDNLVELKNNIAVLSPDQSDDSDETQNMYERKYLGDVNLNAVKYFNKTSDRHAISPSKSMPDLPKIVDVVPKESHLVRPALPRVMGLSRKYVGPVKYPVTPAKYVSTSTVPKLHHQLSILAKSTDQQVFI